MAKLIPFPTPLTPQRFEQEVQNRAQFSHMVIQTDHFKEQMLKRDITLRQVLNTLRKGSLKKPPTYNQAHATYEGSMTYHGTGREITVVCALRGSELTVFAVTVY